jgi:hypothetical protein
MVDIVSLYDSLLDASIGGAPFLYVDARDEPGRRTLRFLFPGSDIPAFIDLGHDDGPLHLTGCVIGDDHVRQANRLRAVFSQPGPYTLVHPWLGTFLVMPERRPVFTDAQDSIRRTTFEVSLWRFQPLQPALSSTLDGLLDQLDALRLAARAALRQVLAPIAGVLSALGTVTSFASQAGAWFHIAVGGGLQNIVIESLTNLSGVAAIIPTNDYGDAVTDTLAAPSAALAGATTPPIPSAIGPGDAATTPTPVDGRLTAGAMLTVAGDAAASSGPPPWPVLSLALQALLLADSCSAASDIEFTDQQEAMAWRDRVAGALDTAASAAAAAAAAAIAPASPVALGELWAALVAVRAAWLADMNAVIGRLPAVATLVLPATPVSVWLVAQYLAGDTPANLVATVDAVMARNRLYSPAIEAATVEILQ